MAINLFPATRQVYTSDGTGQPVFSSDIENLYYCINELFKSVIGKKYMDGYGVGDVFFILDGLYYDGVSSYSPGIVLLNGVIYIVKETVSTGEYLEPKTLTGDTGTELYPKLNFLNVSKATYKEYEAVPTSIYPDNGCPPFSGDMDNFRMNLFYLLLKIGTNKTETDASLALKQAKITGGWTDATPSAIVTGYFKYKIQIVGDGRSHLALKWNYTATGTGSNDVLFTGLPTGNCPDQIIAGIGETINEYNNFAYYNSTTGKIQPASNMVLDEQLYSKGNLLIPFYNI